MRHWLGFLILACMLAVGISGLLHNIPAAMFFTYSWMLLFVIFVIRGFLRWVWGSSQRRRA